MHRKAIGIAAAGAAVGLYVLLRGLGKKRTQTLRLMEAEEIARVTQGKPTRSAQEPVETASEDSFPASDAPAWTGTTGPTG